MWQDVNARVGTDGVGQVRMTDQDSGATAAGGQRPIHRREVSDAETMRALSDPLRIGIMRLLMRNAEVRPAVMSAKEIAAALHEPQTKLYRHLRQLEEAKLIEVAETRVVSGITEQRYRTAQVSLTLSTSLVQDPETLDAVAEGVKAAFEEFSDEFRRHLRANRISIQQRDGENSIGGLLQTGTVSRMSPATARRFSQRLKEIVDEFDAIEDEPDGVPVNMIIGFYAVTGQEDD
jgi:DNA-binding transcriptional ArsR family regulator